MPFDVSQIAVPFRMQPGLRRAAPGSMPLTPALQSGRHFREKMAVLSACADQALVGVAGFDAAPALAAIAAEASRAPRPAFTFDRAGNECATPRIGWAIRDGAVHGDGDAAVGALLRALPERQRIAALLSLAFEEDLAVIDASARVPWLAVCLPSRWAPEDKIGRHLAEIHAPVADNAMLVAASEQLARLVTGPERWERFVWTVSADPRLHQHPARAAATWAVDADSDADNDTDGEALAAQASFRSEHQTFLPVDGAGQAVFTIHIDSEPLRQAIGSRELAVRVRDSLASMSPAVLAYRGLDKARDRLLAWLSARADSLPASAA